MLCTSSFYSSLPNHDVKQDTVLTRLPQNKILRLIIEISSYLFWIHYSLFPSLSNLVSLRWTHCSFQRSCTKFAMTCFKFSKVDPFLDSIIYWLQFKDILFAWEDLKIQCPFNSFSAIFILSLVSSGTKYHRILCLGK